MPDYGEERLGRLLALLRPAPRGWVEAAQELPRVRPRLDEIVERAREDAEFRAAVVADLERALAAAGHTLAERDIVLLHTGRDAFMEGLDYVGRGPGVTADATRWLYDRGVRVMGIDAWGWDQPLWMQAERARATDAPGVFWAAHQAGLPYCQIERLTNLSALPPTGFQVACFPLRVAGGSAGPARVVAIVPD